MKKRKIAVVTGTRAEYGILKPLLERIKNSKNLELKLLVTGMHLLKKFGLTANEIKKDGFKIEKEVEMYIGKDGNPSYYGKSLAQGINKFTEVLSRTKPDILVVIGDRLEPFAAVIAAATLKIPVAHIHGGDKTDSGHIDESIRHSISRFSNIHFAPTRKSKERLIKSGEESWRVYNVGALNLDSILNVPKLEKESLFKKLGINYGQKIILCVFNPVHLEAKEMGKQMRQIIQALKELKNQTVIIYPNNDSGSQDIIKEIEKNRKVKYFKIFKNIFHTDYVNLFKCVDVMIGNSSSGIIEAPSIKLPVINIGSRNVGREHAGNIIFVRPKKNKIKEAVKKALYNNNFKRKIGKVENPYGEGKTSQRIVKILEKIKLDKKLLQKKITY